jgi:hypothetical protein
MPSIMTRLSPITIGLSIVAALAQGATIYLISCRSSRGVAETAGRDRSARAIQQIEGSRIRSTPAVPVPATALRERLPSIVIVDDASAATGEVATTPQPPSAEGGLAHRRPAIDRHAMIKARHRYHQTWRADEVAFEILQIAEPIRAAIRTINEAHRPSMDTTDKMSERGSSPPQGGADPLLVRDEGARRAAIDRVLGADLAKALYAAESSARVEAMTPPSFAPGGLGTSPPAPAQQGLTDGGNSPSPAPVDGTDPSNQMGTEVSQPTLP